MLVSMLSLESGLPMTEEMKSIYDGLWKRRNLEIQMLWTRLTMLGTFMALTYTGYGFLIIKIMDGVSHWEVFNLLAMAAGCFGVIFSVLWITMAKGSKGWFERYEAMIDRFHHEHGIEFKAKGGKSSLPYLDQGHPDLKPFLKQIDASFLTQCAGRFSVSKIPIVMGQISMLGWGLVIAGHFWCLLVDRDYMRLMVEDLSVNIGCIGILGLCLAVSIIRAKVRSGSL